MKQKSIKNEFSLSGIGIHSGERSKATIKPMQAGSGIVFVQNGIVIPASLKSVASTMRGTVLINGSAQVHTVEHLLAAIYGLGIDNLLIELQGVEIPILDGSAAPYVEALTKAGVVSQDKDKKNINIRSPLEIRDGEKFIKVEPSPHFIVSFEGDFQFIGMQKYNFSDENNNFTSDIAPARTFGYVEELESLKKQGLGQGASPDNALVLSKDGYVNAPRFEDEPARHKILDIIGDLALLCRPIKGKITGFKCGHKINIELARKLEDTYAA